MRIYKRKVLSVKKHWKLVDNAVFLVIMVCPQSFGHQRGCSEKFSPTMKLPLCGASRTAC